MANSVYRGSDTAPTTILSNAAAPSTLTMTGWIDVRSFTHVDFLFKLTNGQSVTDLEIAVDFSMEDDANAAPYPLMVEEIDTGPPVRAVQARYVVEAAGVFNGATGAYALPVPVHGHYMRVLFSCGPAVGTDEIEVLAYRRTS